MLGNGLLAFGVLAVVAIFLYMSFRLERKQEGDRKYAEVYDVALVSGFEGDSVSVYVNDSLLYSAVVGVDTVSVRAPRTADGNVLVIESHRNNHTDYFNLKPEGGSVVIARENGVCSITH